MKGMATEKQVRYAMYLLSENGYSTKYMDSRFKQLGATMKERSGYVEDWLENMDMPRISTLIKNLKEKQ